MTHTSGHPRPGPSPTGPLGDPDAPPDPEAAGSQRSLTDWLRWSLRKLAMIAVGCFVYAVATGIFSQMPQIDSQLYVWIFLGIVSAIALVCWIRSERGDDS